MKLPVIICGSRTFDEGILLPYYLLDLLPIADDIEIIEGGALGADLQARYFAKYYNIPYRTFKADWDLWGLAAGTKRNIQMKDYALKVKQKIGAPQVRAFWDGHSRGTKHMINVGIKSYFDVRIHRYYERDFYFNDLLLDAQAQWKRRVNSSTT